jgi:hypothetical protein
MRLSCGVMRNNGGIGIAAARTFAATSGRGRALRRLIAHADRYDVVLAALPFSLGGEGALSLAADPSNWSPS